MNRSLLLILLLGFGVASSQQPRPIRPSVALLRELDSLTPVITRDTVLLYFRRDSVMRLGTAVDPRFYGEVRAWYPGLGEFPQDRDLFGIARVALGDGILAYVVRAPSQYAPTAIDIWPFDQRAGTLGPPVRAADGFGDGAWFFQMDAWLVDLNSDGVRDIVQRRRDWWEDDETEQERQSDSLFIMHRRAGQFQPRRLSGNLRLRQVFDVPDWMAR